jgi:EF hand domain-containing protein
MLFLTKEIFMFTTKKKILALIVIAGFFAIGSEVKAGFAVGQTTNATTQSAASTVPPPTPAPKKVVAGQTEALKLLLLMDTDKNGKVSRAEFTAFMAAEFDRMDVNHDGELDVKELEQSQLMVAHHGGTHR